MSKWLALLRAKDSAPPLPPTVKTVKRGSEGAFDSFDSDPIGGCTNSRGPAPNGEPALADAGLPPATTLPAEPAATPDRPHKLAQAEADAAHAEPWGDAAVARFLARVAAIRRRGFVEQDADDLAERLHRLDLQAEGRSLCLSCRHLAGSVATGWRCNNHRAAEVARDLPADFVAIPQRCPGLSTMGGKPDAKH